MALSCLPELTSADYDFIYGPRCFIPLRLCVCICHFFGLPGLWEISCQFPWEFVINAEDTGENIEFVQVLK